MVEFVIVAPILLLLVFGIIQFGIYLQQLGRAHGCRACRRAAGGGEPDAVRTPTGTASGSGHQGRRPPQGERPGDHRGAVRPAAAARTAWAQGGDVTVTATYPYSINLLGFVVKSGRMTSQTTERVE